MDRMLTGRDLLGALAVASLGALVIFGAPGQPVLIDAGFRLVCAVGVIAAIWQLYRKPRPSKPIRDTSARDAAVGRWIERVFLGIVVVALVILPVLIWYAH